MQIPVRGAAACALLAAALCLSGTAIAATTYYVSTDGNDAKDGRSLSAAFRTLKKAVSVVEPGDAIEVRAGTYDGGITLSRPGTKDAWITLKPYRNEKVVIDGTGKHAFYFYRDDFAPMYWTVEGLEARGGEHYVVKIDTPFVTLRHNNLHGSKGDIIKVVNTAHNITIHGNEIHSPDAAEGANAQGIDIVGSRDVVVSHNYVHDIPSIAMYAKGGATNVVFERNRVENVLQRGIMLGQSTDRTLLDPKRPYESYDSVIRENFIRNVGGACLATASSSNAKIHDNTCYNVASRSNGAIFVSNESELGQAGTNIEIRDNVIVRAAEGNQPMIFVTKNALTDDKTLKIDGNTYWTLKGKDAITFRWERDDSKERKAAFPSIWDKQIDRWQKLTGLDGKSTLAQPALRQLREAEERCSAQKAAEAKKVGLEEKAAAKR